MSYVEFEDLCGEAWKGEEYIHFYLTDLKRKMRLKIVIAEKTHLDCKMSASPKRNFSLKSNSLKDSIGKFLLQIKKKKF